MIKKINSRYIVFGAFLFFFLFQFIQVFKFNFFVQSDDFGYIADSAFFAGYNWNPYTGDMTPYYNIGFPLFSAFIFRIFDDFSWIYRGLITCIILWQIALMYLVYRIIKNYFELSDYKSVFIALLYSMGSMAPQNGLYYMAEVPFSFFSVLCLYFLLKSMNQEGKKKIFFTILFSLSLAFSYAVHTRFLVLIATLFCVCILYHVIYKKSLINYAVFILSFIFCFGLIYFWVKNIQNTLYYSDLVDGASNGNDALVRLTYIGDFIGALLTFEGLERFAKTFISLMSVNTLLTGGLIWISCVVVIVNLYRFLKSREDSLENQAFFVLSIFALISFFGMNLLISVNGATNMNEYKWLTYYRYGKPFIGLILILFLIILYRQGVSKKQIVFSFVGVIISIICSLRFTMRSLQAAEYSDVSPVGWLQYFFYYGQSIDEYFKLLALISLCVSCVIFLFFFIKHYQFSLIVFLLFSMSLTYSENEFNCKISDANYKMIDRTLCFIREKRDLIDIPMYFLQGSYSGRLRFALYDTEMEYILTEKDYSSIDSKNAVVLSDYDLWEYKEDKKTWKYRIKLDDSEYVFTSNKKQYKKLMEDDV